ncbi:MAG: LLM class flavin-dependent oxidoreductase [Planctomycetota bacterium]
MKFCYFTPVPWPHLDRRPDHWPFPTETFDATQAAACYDNAIEQLVHAEACGFDMVGIGEDHMTAYGIVPNPMLLLSAVARQTSRIKLATMGTPAPLLNPVRVAEEMAMLDVLSNGRAIAGLIRGVPQNYAAYNVDPAESRERFAEAVELIERCWTNDDVWSWTSTHYNFPSLSVWPKPVTKRGPPMLFSGNSVESGRFAASRRAMIGAIHLYNLDALNRVASVIDAYKEVAAADGWTPDQGRFLIGLPTCIASTDQEAADRLAPALDYQFNILSGTYNQEKRRIAATTPGYGLSPTEEEPPSLHQRLESGIVLCGSPATVIDQIRRLHDRLGVGTVAMHMQVGLMTPAHVRESMDHFADAVRPAFQAREAVTS